MREIKIAQALFLVLILYTVLVDTPISFENFASMRNAQFQKSIAYREMPLSFPRYKAIKDLLLIFSYIFLLGAVFWQGITPISRRLITFKPLLILGALLCFSAIHSIIWNGLYVGLIGLRAFLSLLVFYVGTFMTSSDIKKMAHLIGILIIFQMIVSVGQQVVGYIWLDVTELGYRSTGTFYDPNTLGMFGVACLTVFLLYPGLKWKYLYFISALVVVVLSGSRTAVLVVLVALFIQIFLNRNNPLPIRGMAAALVLPIILLLPSFLELVTGRTNVMANIFSEGGRLWSFLNYLESASFTEIIIGKGLGMGTNALSILSGFITIPAWISIRDLITDSIYTSLFIQGGALLLLSYVSFVITPLFVKGEQHFPLLLPLVMTVAGLGSITIEVYPFNVIMLALYGFYASGNNSLPSHQHTGASIASSAPYPIISSRPDLRRAD